MIYCPGGQVRTRNQFSLHILASLLLFLQAFNTISVILDLTLEYELDWRDILKTTQQTS